MNDPTPTPEDCLERIRDPRVATARLVSEHGALLYSLGLRFCGDEKDAEDLVQETFLQAMRHWHTFEGRSSVRTWLYAIAARVCSRFRRKRAGEPGAMESLDERALFADGTGGGGVAVGPAPDAATEAIRREARSRVEAAIAGLPEDYRIPLVLKEIVGLTVPEIAAVTGLAEGTVKSRVHRARLRLREAVEAGLPAEAGVDRATRSYEEQLCLDLLAAKQEALDRGVPFDESVVCARCRAVFAMLDLTHDACRDLASGRLPDDVRERLLAAIADQGRSSTNSAKID